MGIGKREQKRRKAVEGSGIGARETGCAWPLKPLDDKEPSVCSAIRGQASGDTKQSYDIARYVVRKMAQQWRLSLAREAP